MLFCAVVHRQSTHFYYSHFIRQFSPIDFYLGFLLFSFLFLSFIIIISSHYLLFLIVIIIIIIDVYIFLCYYTVLEAAHKTRV